MARRSEERTFTIAERDARVMVTQYDAFDALDLFVKLIDVIAPSASTIISGLVRGTIDTMATIEGDELAEALQGTIGKIKNRTERELMVFQIFRGTQIVIDGEIREPRSTSMIGLIFEADMAALFQVMGFALQVQYGNFWHAASREIERRMEAAKAEKLAAIEAAKAEAAKAAAAKAAAEAPH